MSQPLPRHELVRRGRVAVLDDNAPDVVDDIRASGMSVDLIESTENPRYALLESPHYDVLLLDYAGVGTSHGSNEGLDVLRHLRRVNPTLRIVAFTGRTFDASKADFFRMCDTVVSKDCGITDLLEVLEDQLAQALTISYQWSMLCSAAGLDPSSAQAQKAEIQVRKAMRKVGGGEVETLAGKVKDSFPGVSSTVIQAALSKMIELGLAALG